jgi:hypothetical protein
MPRNRAESTFIERYGMLWPRYLDSLQIEFKCIQKGGRWKDSKGKDCGAGLYQHYANMERLIWPEDDVHRWSTLCMQTLVENTITVLVGPADSNKTYIASKWGLMEYWVYPNDTLVLVSSTDTRGLELRVWGTIKDLFNRARARYEWLPGHPIDSLHTITTYNIDEERAKARVLKTGIICIPCLQNGRYVGVGKYHGIKQKRLRQISDESQLMSVSHLDAIPNYLGKDYKAAFLGNPIDVTDPLGRIGEPQEGWPSVANITKTTTWRTRMHNGVCVNLVGTDSPNFDFPPEQPVRYPYLINWKKITAVEEFWGKDSLQFSSQCVGVMRPGLTSRRIITRQMCQDNFAFAKALWANTKQTRVYGIDAAYSGVGGDRCTAGWAEFGESLDGTQILRVNPIKIVPVSVITKKSPEDQIAEWVKIDAEAAGIPPENIFYDSTGRGTLGAAFAKLFGDRTPVPVEFGGKPSVRPVRHDLFVEEDNQKRHKRCDEHFLDFVSELWFSAAYIILCQQMRELPEEVMLEGCAREYGRGRNNKLFIESKHDKKARERMVRSPDLFDCLVTITEGARQRGFQIEKLGKSMVEQEPDDWFEREREQYRDMLQSKLLTHK